MKSEYFSISDIIQSAGNNGDYLSTGESDNTMLFIIIIVCVMISCSVVTSSVLSSSGSIASYFYYTQTDD